MGDQASAPQGNTLAVVAIHLAGVNQVHSFRTFNKASAANTQKEMPATWAEIDSLRIAPWMGNGITPNPLSALAGTMDETQQWTRTHSVKLGSSNPLTAQRV